MEATEGANREGHSSLAGWRIVGGIIMMAQETSPLAQDLLTQRIGNHRRNVHERGGLRARCADAVKLLEIGGHEGSPETLVRKGMP